MSKCDQLAYYCVTATAADHVKRCLGLENAAWIKDRVTAKSRITSDGVTFIEAENVADLAFNYDHGIELEILRYIDGPFWHSQFIIESGFKVMKHPFISHIGFHLDDDEPFPEMPGCLLVQETWTLSHTAEYLTSGPAKGRTYHYRIFEMGPGNYAKYIKRIHSGAK